VKTPIALICLLAVVAVATSACTIGGADKTGGGDGALELTVVKTQRADFDIEAWTRAVDRLSGGKIRLRIVGEWHKGQNDLDRQMLAAVGGGTFDLGVIRAAAFDRAGTQALRPLLAPLLIDSYSVERRVFSDPIVATVLHKVRSKTWIGVGLVPGRLQRPVGLKRDFLAASSFRGAAFGVREGGVATETFRALGAAPTPFVTRDSDVSALDGVEATANASTNTIVRSRARSVTTNVVLWPRVMAIVMNSAAYDRLSAAQRSILDRAWRSSSSAEIARFERDDPNELKGLCVSNRVRLMRGDATSVLRAVTPVLDRIARSGASRQAYARIVALKNATAVPASTPHCAKTRPAPSPGAATAVDGTWTASMSYAEYVAAKPFADEDWNTNWGVHTLKLNHGSWDWRSDRDPDVRKGTYTIKGDLIVFDDPFDHETWRYRFTLYHGALTFRRAQTTTTPTSFIVKPWHQAG
jgi:TRAP-type C4-dicarboxylate transport system substrate-binding protein